MRHAKPVATPDNQQYQRRLFKLAIPALVILIVGGGIAGAIEWLPRQGCGHTVARGDTLSAISRSTGTPVTDMVTMNPHITDPNLIRRGEQIDVCAADIEQPRQGTLAPQRLVDWAQAVHDTRPSWATDQDARFLVAVSGPESNHCSNIWNPGDASSDGKWTGSYGCIQIRILANPSAFPSDAFRNRAWLAESKHNQARAAWIVLQRQDRTAWGPVRDGKLPSESCAGSSNVDRCLTWWSQADAAIDYAALIAEGLR